MLFNSYEFVLLFLPIVIGVFYFLNHRGWYKISKLFILAVSLFFYGYFDWSNLYIIVFSIIFNFVLSRLILFFRKRSTHGNFDSKYRLLNISLVCIGVVVNIGSIIYYKYYAFIAENINYVFGTNFVVARLILPIGISFYTFQQISYLIDSYTGKAPKYALLDYALFVTYFPNLTAGPIVLHNELVPQFTDSEKKYFNNLNFSQGLYAFTFGLAKKVLLADRFAKIADWGFSSINTLGFTNSWLVMLAYTLQIYFDFSGYSDMATGIGKMMNIDLPMNFNSPYKACNLSDFWKRWHMTLTRFFRTYLYFPLGGNRRGVARTYLNVLIVFLVSGLWHGANWTFVVWGAVHGIASILTKRFRSSIARWHPAFQWFSTFVFVSFAWVLFRSESISAALVFYKQLLGMKMYTVNSTVLEAFRFPEFSLFNRIPIIGKYFYSNMTFIVIFLALLAVMNMKNTNERIVDFKPNIFRSLITAMLLFWCVISLSGVTTFLYWNF